MLAFIKLIVWLQQPPKLIASDYITTGTPLGAPKADHKWFMELHKSFMEIHNSLMEIHNSLMEIHNSCLIMYCHNWFISIIHLWRSIIRFMEIQQSNYGDPKIDLWISIIELFCCQLPPTLLKDLSMMYRALWDRRHEGATRISQCTWPLNLC